MQHAGAGERLAAKHGQRGTRTWRKLHLAVDPGIGEILASGLTTNEEGDAAQVGPLLGQSPLQSITEHGRAAWQKAFGCTKRDRAEAAIGRFK